VMRLDQLLHGVPLLDYLFRGICWVGKRELMDEGHTEGLRRPSQLD